MSEGSTDFIDTLSLTRELENAPIRGDGDAAEVDLRQHAERIGRVMAVAVCEQLLAALQSEAQRHGLRFARSAVDACLPTDTVKQSLARAAFDALPCALGAHASTAWAELLLTVLKAQGFSLVPAPAQA
ncbi:MAG: hypothetical protein Q4G70_13740 [Pseudomonadota bacterium]|nr:hypothetical protein [Pseudomonadota bacterium]